MQMRRVFVYVDGRETKFGEAGFVPNWMGMPDDFDPGYGLTIAHDMLEHRLADRGNWNEECMAFGAMLYTRGKRGYFDGRGQADRTGMLGLGAELADLWFDNEMPHLTPAPAKLPQSTCEEFARLIKPFRVGFNENLYLRYEDEADGLMQRPTTDWLGDTIRWASYGYIQAQKRYHRVDDAIRYVFEAIERTTRKQHLERNHPFGDLAPGDKLSITLNDRFANNYELSVRLNGYSVPEAF